MKIAIVAGGLIPIHARSLEERPVGGTETAVIRIAENLQNLGHEVTVFTRLENPPESRPKYLPIQQIENYPPVDLLISVRDWIPLFYRIPAKKRAFWTGDSYDQFSNYGLGDKRVVQQTDWFFAVSQWQANQICERSGFPRQKVYILRNGIQFADFKDSPSKVRKRLIYSSTPHRGLKYVPSFFKALQTKHPDLELRVFSSYKIYDQNLDFEDIRNSFNRLSGAVIFDSIKQKELATEFSQASILFYPCDFEETSCITAMEAMAGSCVVLSSELGALPETVGDAGILIPGHPSNETYVRSFLESADRLLSDDAFFSSLSSKARIRAEAYDWKVVAQDLSRFLESEMK